MAHELYSWCWKLVVIGEENIVFEEIIKMTEQQYKACVAVT